MILGIVGSRSLKLPLPEELMPPYIDTIISGGAKGIDKCARNYAFERHIGMLEILPEYDRYGRRAPLMRNDWIISLSDMIYIFWDGKSRGTAYVIKKCAEIKKPHRVFIFENGRYIPIKECPYEE